MAKKQKPVSQETPLEVINDPMAFDIGFQLPEQVDLEGEMSQLITDLEDVRRDLTDQVEVELAGIQGGVASLSTGLQDQLYNELQSIQSGVNGLQNDLETQLAAQVGNVYALANQIDSSITLPGESFEAVPSSVAPGAVNFPQAGIVAFPIDTPDQVIRDWWQGLCNSFKGPTREVVYSRLGINQRGLLSLKVGPFVYPIQYIPNYSGCGGNPAIVMPNSPFPGLTLSCCLVDSAVIPQPPPSPPGQPPVYPPVPPPPYQPPCPPCPTTPPKPTVPGSSCESPMYIKTCGDEQKKTPPTKYKVFCTKDKTIYIQDAEKEPLAADDIQVGSGGLDDINFKSICKECRDEQEEESPRTQIPEPSFGVVSPPCDFMQPVEVFTNLRPQHIFSYIFGVRNLDGSPRGDAAVDELSGFVKPVVKLALQATRVVTDSVGFLFQNISLHTPCTQPGYLPLSISKTIGDFLKQWFGVDNRHLSQQIEQNQNSLCPQGIPTSEGATAAYLADAMEKPTLDCIVKANNQRLDFWNQVVWGARSKLNPQEILTAWRRDLIAQPELFNKFRELGYLVNDDIATLQKLTEQVPAVSDLMTMMMRDVADEVTINWQEVDNLFALKWTGDIEKWGEWQGIPKLMAKYIWRAHFQIPSPTQLFEFWHRLRYNGMLGTKDQTYQKIRDALIQQDIAPQWIDAYLAVSFRPLTRVDVRRAFNLDLLSPAEVEQSYLDQGYSDDNAKRLLRFAENQRLRQYDKHPLIAKYVNGEVTLIDIDQELRTAGVSSPLVARVMDRAIIAAEREKRKVCVRAYRKRFLQGEFDLGQTVVKVTNLGLQALQATQIVSRWECEKVSIGKQVPSATLCHWFDIGLIDGVEFYTRLTTLGYADDDAIKIINDCRDKIGKKLAKDQQVAIAQLRREREKAARLAKSLVKEFNADADKAARFAERQRQIMDRRRKLLLEAADKYSRRTETPITENLDRIKAIVKSATLNTATTIDFVYQSAVTVADQDNVASMQDFSRELAALLTAVV